MWTARNSSASCKRNSFRGASKKELPLHVARPRVPFGAPGIVPVPHAKILQTLLERHKLIDLQPLIGVKKKFLLDGCFGSWRKAGAVRADHTPNSSISFLLQKGGAGRLMRKGRKARPLFFPRAHSVAALAKIEEAQEIMEFACPKEEKGAHEDSALEHTARKLFRVCPHCIAMTTNVRWEAYGLSPCQDMHSIGHGDVAECHRKVPMTGIVVIEEDVDRRTTVRWTESGAFRPFDTTDARVRSGRQKQLSRIALGQAVQIDVEKLAMLRCSIALLEGKGRALDTRADAKSRGKPLKKCRFAGADRAREADSKGNGVESTRERPPRGNCFFRIRKPNSHCLSH